MTPNLFIIGAARCGTTSLHSILGQHPQIHASACKEPTFFVGTCQVITNPIAYFHLFDSPKRYRMESSVAYLPCPETAPVLRALFPNARFMVSLRDPKARAYSLYRHMRYAGLETVDSFFSALQAEDSRYNSREFSVSRTWDITTYLYRRSSLYDEHLARYFELFEREQFYITTLADLQRNPRMETERILRFLDLDISPSRHFDYSIRNRREASEPLDEQSDELLTAAFNGLHERTEHLVGHALDWSL